MPKGAFYVFPNITATGWKSKPLADALLEADWRSRALRHRLWPIRRRLCALQRRQLAEESGSRAGTHRSLDEGESCRSLHSIPWSEQELTQETCATFSAKEKHMALRDSKTGEIIRNYSVEELCDAASVDARLRSGCFVRSRFGPLGQHALHHGYCRGALSACGRSRPEESIMAGSRPHRLVGRPQGAGALRRAGLRGLLPAERSGYAAQTLLAVSGASALAQVAGC